MCTLCDTPYNDGRRSLSQYHRHYVCVCLCLLLSVCAIWTVDWAEWPMNGSGNGRRHIGRNGEKTRLPNGNRRSSHYENGAARCCCRCFYFVFCCIVSSLWLLHSTVDSVCVCHCICAMNEFGLLYFIHLFFRFHYVPFVCLCEIYGPNLRANQHELDSIPAFFGTKQKKKTQQKK